MVMAALCSMARQLMLRRAMSASWPALRMTPATRSSAIGHVEEAVLDEASVHEFCRLVADHYEKDMKFVCAVKQAGVVFAGAAAITSAGFGIYRLNSSFQRDQ